MTKYFENKAALILVIAVHAAAVGAVVMPQQKKAAQITPPTLQGILLASAPPEEVAPVVKPIPPKPKPKPKIKPKKKEISKEPKPKPPPSERAPQKIEEIVEEVPLPNEDTSADIVAPASTLVPPQMDANPLNNPAPVYPKLSRRLKEQGTVLLEILILPDGSVGEARLKKSSGYARLDATALKAIKRWRYVPAKQGEQAIEYWYLQALEFTLN